MQEIFCSTGKQNYENRTYTDYIACMADLLKKNYKIDSHEFTLTDGRNGLWVILATKIYNGDLGPD